MNQKIRLIAYGLFLIVNAMAFFEGLWKLMKGVPYASAYIIIFAAICIDAIYNANKEAKRDIEQVSNNKEV
jgi:hypothetical protein